MSYGSPDVADPAGAYAYELARNHGFVNGNKRTAWVVARVFLAESGAKLHFNPLDAIRVMEAVANGSMGKRELAAWFRQHTTTT
ncbi:type II toxin-antitoxin system death-on-curing family toxin [Rhodomicrobium lacus]|uniref:type II toxin-antitoxin system death-on-curing family toxin n=1 Tax=Rhodomicrobium lacus TaxID=2498452 RepID=UPI001FDF6C61|nr:type II toxin-antitoxin system death-on-curing family toxin [Rhodomicrobium lacus]